MPPFSGNSATTQPVPATGQQLRGCAVAKGMGLGRRVVRNHEVSCSIPLSFTTALPSFGSDADGFTAKRHSFEI